MLGPHHAWRTALTATPEATILAGGSPLEKQEKSDRITRVVLLGFMCSGKSTVGAHLAQLLDWDYVDFDVEIERREERPVAEIIEREGEGYFRRLEAGLTEEAAAKSRLILAPGGGWITRPELLEALGRETFSIWLRVSPQETVRRLKSDPRPRPFKDDPDAIVPIRKMIDEREPLFRRANLVLPSDDADPPELARRIAREVSRIGLA
jgi:shikimate kinase